MNIPKTERVKDRLDGVTVDSLTEKKSIEESKRGTWYNT